MFSQQQGENTVMENVDKLWEDSVLCPIRQRSIFKADPYRKPFPLCRKTQMQMCNT